MPINMIIFSGTIVGNPRYNQGQSTICDFFVEQEEQGTKRDGTTFVSRNRQTVKVFGRAADAAARELRSGMSVIVQGRMAHTCKKQDNGDYAHYYSILADRWEVLGIAAQQTQPPQQMTFGGLGYVQPPQGGQVQYVPQQSSYAYAAPTPPAPLPPVPPSAQVRPLQAPPPPAPPSGEAKDDDVPF